MKIACECGKEAELIDLNMYGAGKPGGTCITCFISNNFPDSTTINATRLSVDGEIVWIPDDAECVNCGSHVLSGDALRSKGWDQAVEEYEASGYTVKHNGKLENNYTKD